MRLATDTGGSFNILKSDNLVIGGYASIEVVDKQNDLITLKALNEAVQGFMGDKKFRNVMSNHSNVQVGEVIESYRDTNGTLHKTQVDDVGFYVVIKLRDDIEKAREVAAEIRKGNLKSFSIGGQAFERVNKHDGTRGDYREISRMELHEVTICEKGINPEAQFRILKEDTTNKGENMTDEENTMSELQNVLERLSKRLDDADEAEAAVKAEDTEKAMKDKEKKTNDAVGDDKDAMDEEDDKKKDEKMAYSKSEEMDDVITTDDLQWLESTVKSAGYDPEAARDALESGDVDGVEKGYSPGEHGFDHRGQGSIEGAGEDDSGKRPKPNFGAAPTGNKNVIKADDYIDASSVSPSQIEEAYQVYKAAALEQRFKTDLGNEFSMRLTKELEEAENAQAKDEFDARGPLADLQKAVLSLSERIENLPVGGETFAKSESPAMMTIPETQEMAEMSWDDVHRLAGKALQGGDN